MRSCLPRTLDDTMGHTASPNSRGRLSPHCRCFLITYKLHIGILVFPAKLPYNLPVPNFLLQSQFLEIQHKTVTFVLAKLILLKLQLYPKLSMAITLSYVDILHLIGIH